MSEDGASGGVGTRLSSLIGGGSRSVERSLFLVALGLVMVGFAAALYLTGDFDDGPDETVPGMEDAGSGADAEIGPRPGSDLASYSRERATALESAEGRRVAIVSFVDYLTESDARTLLDDGDLDVGVLLVAFPSAEPTATSDLEELRDDLVAEAQEQLPELRSILPTVEDPEFAEFYAAEIERYEQVLAVGNTPEVVYGAIVRGSSPALRDVAVLDRVRLVDVGDADVVTHGAALSGLRPEETTTAGEPPVRPSPPS